MWIFEPGTFAAKSEDWLLHEGYMHSQKARMEFAIANASSTPDEEALMEAAGYVAEEAGIQLSADELRNILSLYPMQRGKFASYGWGDTEVREFILDVVANFIANTRWPAGRDNVDIEAFVEKLKAAAQFMGYATVAQS